MSEWKKVDRASWIVIALSVLGFGIRLVHLGKQGFWFDEAYTWIITDLPLRSAWQALVADGVHPPLYYLLMKVVRLFGETEFIFRLPSVILGTLAIPLCYVLGKRWGGENVGIFSGALLALSPFHIWYSQEARMYALLMTLAIACMLYYDRLLDRCSYQSLTIFIIVSALAYCTHYFALFIPLIQLVHLIVHIRSHYRTLRIWTVAQAVAFLPLLGWVVLLAQRPEQFFGIGWIPKPNWIDVPITLINFFIGYDQPPRILHWFTLAFAVLLIGFALRSSWSRPEARTAVVLWGFLPVALTFLFSLRRPLYIDRFLIGSLPPLYILIAYGVFTLKNQKRRITGSVIVLLLATGIFTFSFGPGQNKEAWREVGEQLDLAQPGEVIVGRVFQIVVPIRYYYRGSLPITAMEVNRQIEPLLDIAEGYSGLWLIFWTPLMDAHRVTANRTFEPEVEENPLVRDWISGRGPTVLSRTDFQGLTVYHFDLTNGD